MINNILRKIKNKNRISIYHYYFFQDFSYKFILVRRSEKVWFLDLRYKNEDWGSWDKKSKKRRYFYSLDKYKSRGVIIADNLF